VQPMQGVKVRPTDNDTICKIIRKSHMKCCGILYAFCNTFSAYFSICFYIFESSQDKVVPVCRYLSTNLCCEILFGGKEHCNKTCLYSSFFLQWGHIVPMVLLT